MENASKSILSAKQLQTKTVTASPAIPVMSFKAQYVLWEVQQIPTLTVQYL